MKTKTKRILNIITAISLISIIAFVLYGMRTGILTDRERLEILVGKSGVWEPILFILIQMICKIFC